MPLSVHEKWRVTATFNFEFGAKMAGRIFGEDNMWRNWREGY